jgi:hypothetical protein
VETAEEAAATEEAAAMEEAVVAVEVEAHPAMVECLPPAPAFLEVLEETAEKLEEEVEESLPPADPILGTLGPCTTGS